MSLGGFIVNGNPWGYPPLNVEINLAELEQWQVACGVKWTGDFKLEKRLELKQNKKAVKKLADLFSMVFPPFSQHSLHSCLAYYRNIYVSKKNFLLD